MNSADAKLREIRERVSHASPGHMGEWLTDEDVLLLLARLAKAESVCEAATTEIRECPSCQALRAGYGRGFCSWHEHINLALTAWQEAQEAP